REGLAPVRVGKLWGFIDRTGDFVVQPSFQTAGEFHEGLARVMYCPPETRIPPLMDYPILRDTFRLEVEAGWRFAGKNVRFGFIDRTGKMQIEPQAWEMADDFSEGLAWVRGRDLKCGYVNRQGQFAFPRRFDHVKPFSEGLASVSVEPKCGYIDKSGEFAIPARFDYCGNFSEGLAVVREASADEDELETMGAIDRSGRYVIPPQYYRLKDFSEGLAIASRNRQRFFIDQRGKKVHITDHQIADLRIEWWGFRDGLAIVGAKGKRVYINKTGKVVAAFEK
ncbi:MAG TPA: WG repeat-containing protein, partial [Terriglobia bacterium]|nr:WG repeat-containing protein [Terriglobia bacterium]